MTRQNTQPDSGQAEDSPRRRWIARFILGLVVVGLLFALADWWSGDAPPPEVVQVPESLNQLSRPEPRPNDYVGSAACVECHPEISQRYRSHPMSRSVYEIPHADLTELAADTEVDVPGPRRYGVTVRDDAIVHYEEFFDAEGNSVYRQDETVTFAIGSGKRGRTYLINRNGLLFQSPLGWYAGGTRWDLSPGYEPADHPRFERQIADGCLACHAGNVRSQPDSPHRFADRPFAEASIGCERCHGPGQSHIDYQNSEPDHTADPIVNPVKLDTVRRDSVCYQCHLHGIKRIPGYGRSEFDFRPGDRLCDNWTVFVNESTSHTSVATRAVSQVEQMLESRCHQQSNGQLSCLSCHDPHGVPAPAERVAFYREQCLNCHDTGQSECGVPLATRVEQIGEDSCINCHMPAFSASDVPHTAQTNHRIVRNAAAIQPFVDSKRNLVVFPAGGAPEEWQGRRAEGILWASRAEDSGDQQAAENVLQRLGPLLDSLPDDVELLEALATASLTLGRTGDARVLGETALEFAPQRESILEGLVLTCARQGDIAAALDYADLLVELNPWLSWLHEWRADLLLRLNEPAEAVQAARQAVQLNPLSRRARQLLIDLYGQTGQEDLKAQEAATLKTLDDNSVSYGTSAAAGD